MQYIVKKSRGFTLIELLVVIAIIGILSSVVLASLNSARTKARDTQRMADMREIAKVMLINTDGEDVALTGCTAADSEVDNCTGPGDLSALQNYSDPVADSGACTPSSSAPCEYAISAGGGGANPTTEDYQVCFYLESGSGSLDAGVHSLEGPSGSIQSDCD